MIEERVQQIIDAVVRERLADARIVSVRVEEDTDSEGDAILRVLVVVEKDKLDGQRVAGLARHARAKLSEARDFRFPIFRFLSKSDAKGLIPAAA